MYLLNKFKNVKPVFFCLFSTEAKCNLLGWVSNCCCCIQDIFGKVDALKVQFKEDNDKILHQFQENQVISPKKLDFFSKICFKMHDFNLGKGARKPSAEVGDAKAEEGQEEH